MTKIITQRCFNAHYQLCDIEACHYQQWHTIYPGFIYNCPKTLKPIKFVSMTEKKDINFEF